MPTIFCSLKLSKLLDLKSKLTSISLNNWNGHLFALEGRKCIAFVEKETLYSFVLFDVLKKDLKDFKIVFTIGFLNQLKSDGLLSEAVKRYIMKDFQDFEISTTDGDRATIGFINDIISRLTYGWYDSETTIERAKRCMNETCNSIVVAPRKYAKPVNLMAAKLELLLNKE